ncbi:glycoside hydrolase family 3 protein [Martelella alba]|uniref:Glycoside hydrolase family 3 protein n=1 Tax=Martelella alba TaxID=2590451 RepID=A0A506U082_9HYPH|nr:glycoside hydrolase family 3 C-terminal domain-containing protein [Martelella alba]TPW26868.1 glycoside hydrolase family 3 protein [Martelella alba]
MQNEVDALVDAMTLEEQVSLLAGASFWYTAEIGRLGVAPIKVTDGPNGARGENFSGGAKSAAFPAEIALAASWDTDLVEEIGTDLGREARTKNAHVLLAPTVNMHRNPQNGRNFECFSEDPHLAARMAVAYIRGVQSQGVGATVKHFVGNECEHERRSSNSAIDEKALREIYLPPFEAAVKEADVACVMTSYNALNGIHMSQNRRLIEDILRDEWGFEGVVMSDWLGNHTTVESIVAGLDLEMPGPGRHRGEKLVTAVREGHVSAESVRRSARRIVALGHRLGADATGNLARERSEDRGETRHLIRRAGAEGTVLLTNRNNLLPLAPQRLKRLAVIGPNAARAVIHGGGSAQINAHYAVSPLEGLRAALPGVEIAHALGCHGDRFLPAIDTAVSIDFYAGLTFEGAPVLSQVGSSSAFGWFGAVAPEVDHSSFSAKLTCHYTAPETGTYDIGLMSAGLSRLFIDGEPVLEAWESWSKGESYFGHGCDERRGTIALQAGQVYTFSVEYACGDGIATTLKAIRFGLRPPSRLGSLEEACRIAEGADAVVIVTGLNEEWETESEDRRGLGLPQGQDELIAAVSAVNANTIVVVQSGSPVTMPWVDDAGAVLQQWYAGQESGNALADVLLGRQEPSGRLPEAFPRTQEDIDALTFRPEAGGTVAYMEGNMIGQRRLERQGTPPLFPFGHGLGYGDVRYRDVAGVVLDNHDVLLRVSLENCGQRDTSEVVQIYWSRPDGSGNALVGFAKIQIAAGKMTEADVILPAASFREWGSAEAGWRYFHDGRKLLIARSAEDICLALTV